ncbi:glycine oxidase ThiO [Rossellomorea vietnamensis]|uniref:glycine oxidase n=1 Tax=Rossellomorea vietnamensis TaxID=218284 RepID=A0A5D4KE28_9BACI|nr:glycine oxidase ThiO [Rossellomorea vietnamensis]TYR75129.1 glycine oxidase ThiO [Rossellomorea vietnamensis]
MNKVYDVIVAGGGIIGSSIAYQQAKLGKKVLIIDRHSVGAEASSAAAGMLGAQAEIHENAAMLQLALKSRSMFPQLLQELEDWTGINAGLVNKGMIKIAQSSGEAAHLQKQVHYHAGWDPEVKWLSGKEMLQQEPALSTKLEGGMLIPNDGQVMAPQLSKAFAQGAAAHGADIIEFCEVENIMFKDQRVKGCETSQGKFSSDQLVITTGAWAGELLKKTGLSLPVSPVKGECFSVVPSHHIIQSTVFSEGGCYIVPKKDGRLIVGATTLVNRWDKDVSLKGVSSLSQKAIDLLPDIKYAKWEKAWAGIRPQTGDGLPYIGPHPAYEGLYIAAGHYRNGILLSPITGKMISDMIERKVPEKEEALYQSFKVDRDSISLNLV